VALPGPVIFGIEGSIISFLTSKSNCQNLPTLSLVWVAMENVKCWTESAIGLQWRILGKKKVKLSV
jgi:hypothetical protein